MQTKQEKLKKYFDERLEAIERDIDSATTMVLEHQHVYFKENMEMLGAYLLQREKVKLTQKHLLGV